MYDNSNRTRSLAIIGLIFAVILIAIVGIVLQRKSTSSTGTVAINLNVPDQNYMKATLNGENFKITGQNDTYQLRPKDYTLVIEKTGYKKFQATFTVVKDQTVTITAKLERNATPAALNTTMVAADNTDISIGKILSSKYFYDNTWAVISVETDGGNSGIVVMNYNDASKRWYTILGPDTVFSTESMQAVPSDVSDYLNQNNYVINNAE